MSFKDSKIAAAANSAMTLSAELAVDTEEYTLCTDGRYEVYTKYQDNAFPALFTGSIPRGVFCERRSQKTRATFILLL